MKRKTCRTCKEFDQNSASGGVCALMGDDSDVQQDDRCYSWGHDDYLSGVHVGINFGCIHWTKKES